MTEGEWEIKYHKYIERYSDMEGISFNSAFETLWKEFFDLKKNEADFVKLLEEWEIE